jgi:predicted metalloprotease
MSKLRKSLLAILTVLIGAVGTVGAIAPDSAHAMSPSQTTVTGTVNTVYWKLDAFWRWAMPRSNYRSPLIGYYSNDATYVAACGTNLYHYTIMANCGNEIWIDVPVNQSKINRLGDYSAGFFLAHEWGHHMADTLGLRFPRVTGREVYADCMAGVFTRYGYSYGKYLDASDYWEAIGSLQDNPYPAEGTVANGYPTKTNRVAWFKYGFDQYNTSSCAQAVNY